MSLLYLSDEYEFTENTSPLNPVPIPTSYLLKTTSNFLDGIADFPFLTIRE